ncbi:MAG: TonB-dependent receptor, partial [Pseudomonadota bacterium]
MNVKLSTAGKKTERLADIPASAVLITRNDIEKYGYMSLEEILENVPGMYVIDDYGPYRKTYGVRGFYAGYPRNIVFLVNGISQAEGVFDYNVMANYNIPVEAIDKIEVVRGPMSVMYGQGAFFGAINIITNDSYDETSLAAVSYGNMSQKAAAKVAGSDGEFKHSISAGYSYTEGPNHSLGKMTSNMAALSGNGINSSNNTTEDRLERDSLNFIFSSQYKHFYTDLMFNHSTDDVCIYKPSIGDGSAYHRNSAKLLLGFENNINTDFRIDTKLTLHHFDFTLDYDVTRPGFSGDAGETNAKADMLEFEIDTFMDVNESLDLTTGLYYKLNSTPEFNADLNVFNLFATATTDDNIHLWAAFTQANFHPWEKLRLVAGVRIEQMFDYAIIRNQPSVSHIQKEFGDEDLELLPNLAAIYSFNERHILKLIYGKAINRPSFFQNVDQIIYTYPDLENEEIQTFEINYIAVPSSNLTLNLSFFHNILDNLIVRTVNVGGVLTNYNANSGDLITNGIEASVQARPFDKFLADLSVTYQKTEDQRTGYENIDVAYSPRLLGYAKLSYEISDNIVCAFTGTYVGSMETEWDGTKNGGAGGRIGDAVDGYSLLGANVRVNNLFDTGAYLNIRCSNLLDKEYHYPTYINNTYADKGTLGNSREFLVTIGYKF